MSVRILLWHRVDGDGAAVRDAYHRVSRALAGTPGLLGNQLLRSAVDPACFVVMSEWTSLTAFQDWEGGATHRGTTAPLRPYQDPRRQPPYEILETVAAYPS
ncbi:antibiotic biosynthesis monooxygenase [Micromonospora coerulea]|uniref:Antibiotic biosynthesis monooxygenase n=1 Tax=Micromonospora coerulea TaxID=47856 RepID=A0ABP8S6L1_9ACTN